MVLVDVFEKGRKILGRENECQLDAHSMHGIERNRALRDGHTGNGQRSAAMRNLPLVVPNKAQLERPAHVLLQGKYLAQSPFIREGLTRCYVGATLFPVNFPGGRQVSGSSLVLGDIDRGATRYSVAPIPSAHVVAASLSESARGSEESVSSVEVDTLSKVPTHVQWLEIRVGKTGSAREIGECAGHAGIPFDHSAIVGTLPDNNPSTSSKTPMMPTFFILKPVRSRNPLSLDENKKTSGRGLNQTESDNRKR